MDNKIGSYTIIKLIGKGAFGVVYEAELKGLHYALKTIKIKP